VPIAITGVLMLLRPSGGAFTAIDYLHIVTGVWWVLLLQWHLYRYLARAMRASRGRSSEAEAPSDVPVA
jgi:hypothetical protein